MILSIILFSQKAKKFSSSLSIDNKFSRIFSNNFWNFSKLFNIFSLSLLKSTKSSLKSLMKIIINKKLDTSLIF
jgi:hypothetical protein